MTRIIFIRVRVAIVEVARRLRLSTAFQAGGASSAFRFVPSLCLRFSGMRLHIRVVVGVIRQGKLFC